MENLSWLAMKNKDLSKSNELLGNGDTTIQETILSRSISSWLKTQTIKTSIGLMDRKAQETTGTIEKTRILHTWKIFSENFIYKIICRGFGVLGFRV